MSTSDINQSNVELPEIAFQNVGSIMFCFRAKERQGNIFYLISSRGREIL